MAWMIPIVASNRRGHRSSFGAVIVGLVIFLILGVFFFLFFNRTGIFGFNFPIIFIIVGFIIFLMIIAGISIAASSMSKTYKPLNHNIYNQNQNNNQKPTTQQNPYIVREPIKEDLQTQYKENATIVEPEVNEVNFCRYCGTKIEKEARFCHECGSKL